MSVAELIDRYFSKKNYPFHTPSHKAPRASFRYSKPNGSKSILSILQAKWLQEHPFDTPSQMAPRASFRCSKPYGSKSILSIFQNKLDIPEPVH